MSNYIGCKISLISKAGIRYEGILYTIDPKESTVALSKVKSFGTEDRKVGRTIAARDEIYEYIIFRGSDISDLNVCEPNKEMTLLNEDSAIVRAESSTTAVHQNLSNNENITESWSNQAINNAVKTPTSKDNETVSNILISPLVNQNTSSSTENKKSTRQDNFKNENSYSQSEVKNNKAKNKTDRYNKTYDRAPQEYYDYEYGNDYNYSNKGYRYGNDYQNHEYYYPSQKQSLSRYNNNSRRDYNYKRNNQAENGQENNKLHGFESSDMPSYGASTNKSRYYYEYPTQAYYSPNYNYEYRSGKEQRNYKSNHSTSNNKRNKPTGAPVKSNDATQNEGFKEDYDFESANAIIAKELEGLSISQEKKELKEGECEKEDGEYSECSDTAFYDKTKSFFDNISSEVTDRANGKTVRTMNRKEERKINVETFGVAESNRGNHRNNGNRSGGAGKWVGNRQGNRGSGSGNSRGNPNSRYYGNYQQTSHMKQRPISVGGAGASEEY